MRPVVTTREREIRRETVGAAQAVLADAYAPGEPPAAVEQAIRLLALRYALDDLDHLRERSDRAARKVFAGGAPADYAQSLARRVENAEGDFDRAIYDAGFDSRDAAEAVLRGEVAA